MNTVPTISSLPQEKPVTQITQQTLFEDLGSAAEQTVGLFAEVVFDRPPDHAYTYAVPERLRELVGVGKRVQAPFGKGDRATVGYCVHLTETPPGRPVKELLRVLDDEPLLDANLLRLTRWMADYYLCGWGQVLNAVVPAGAKDQSGTRRTAFVEAVPDDELSGPEPELTARQREGLRQLPPLGQPVEVP